MIRSRRPIKLTQQLKEEQIDFLWEDIEKNLDEYKKAIALRDNEIAEAKKKNKKNFKEQKRSYDSVVEENQQFKEYIQNIYRANLNF